MDEQYVWELFLRFKLRLAGTMAGSLDKDRAEIAAQLTIATVASIEGTRIAGVLQGPPTQWPGGQVPQ